MLNDPILEGRKQRHINNPGKVNLALKTEKNLLQLRKHQIEDYIMAKRSVTLNENSAYQINPNSLIIPDELKIDIKMFLEKFNINFLQNYIYDSEIHIMKYGIYILRKFIAEEKNHPDEIQYSNIFNAKLLNFLCKLLDYPDITVKYESSWILINTTNYWDESIYHLSTENNLNYMIEFFKNSDEVLLEHGVWLLGNIVADSHINREYVISQDVIDKLVFHFEEFGTSDVLKEKIIWMTCNLTRGKLYNHANYFESIIASLCKYLNTTNEDKEISSCLYAIFKLTSSTSRILEKFISNNIYHIISQYIYETKNLANKTFCVKIVANLTGGNDVQTQRLIGEGIVYLFKQLLEEEDIKILKETLWGLSNICAGTVSQIQKVYDEGLITKVLDIITRLLPTIDEDKIYQETLREALFCITNTITGGLNVMKVNVLQNGKINLIKLLIESIKIFLNEKRLLEMLLHSLKCYITLEEDEAMLDYDESLKNMMIVYGIEDITTNLLDYPNENVKDVAGKILDLL